MKQDIELSIRTTLVVLNKQSMHIAVDKIMEVFEQNMNGLMNDAFCTPKRIKPLPTNSNKIAEFINKWITKTK